MKMKVLQLLLLTACMAILAPPLVQGKGKKAKRCRNPKGPAGSVRVDGCLQKTCSKGKWKTEMRSDVCCYNQKDYPTNSEITKLVGEDNCTTTTISCTDNAMFHFKKGYCERPASKQQVVKLEKKIDNIEKQLTDNTELLLGMMRNITDLVIKQHTCPEVTNCTTTTTKSDNTLIFLGPGRGTSGQSEVFFTPISENKDLTTQTCTVPQFPFTYIEYSVGFIYEDLLHICGGLSSHVQSACFSLINSTWSETTPMLTARSAPAAVRMQNGSVLVSGGYSGSSRLQTSELLTGSTWTPSIQLPSQRTGHCMLQLSTGEMFMHGGYSGLFAVNDTHISKDHASWEKVMSSKHKGGYHACTEVIINSDQQVWIGGIRKTEICQLVDGTWTWTDGPDLPTTCNTGYNRFISNNGKMFYSCGYDKNIYQLKDNWQTNKLDAWAKIGEMSERRRYFPAMLITEDVCKGIKTPVQSAAANPPGPG